MQWLPKIADPAQVDSLAPHLHLPVKNRELASTLARLLVIRGITDPEIADRFLAPKLDHLHSPYLMTGMKTAVDRIDTAIERKEGMLIYGDYDVDGTTAIV